MGPGLGRLNNKVAIVTGADNGIGRATARLFAREGARVVCLDLQESGRQRIDRVIEADGGKAVFIQGDVTRMEDCNRMVQTAVSEFGGLDIVFNNPGGRLRGRIHEVTEEQWDWVVNLNLKGLFHAVRAAIPQFLKQGHGTMVNNASSLGVLAVPQSPAYCTTKAAIIMLTRQMALDYGPTIRVNCVCAGPIDTGGSRAPLAPGITRGRAETSEEREARVEPWVAGLHRSGLPEEVAYAVLFLASDESSFVTGHALVVDGGQTIDA